MTLDPIKFRDPYAKRGQCDYSKTGWSWQYEDGACRCDPCPPPDGWKYNKKEGEWLSASPFSPPADAEREGGK